MLVLCWPCVCMCVNVWVYMPVGGGKMVLLHYIGHYWCQHFLLDLLQCHASWWQASSSNFFSDLYPFSRLFSSGSPQCSMLYSLCKSGPSLYPPFTQYLASYNWTFFSSLVPPALSLLFSCCLWVTYGPLRPDGSPLWIENYSYIKLPFFNWCDKYDIVYPSK